MKYKAIIFDLDGVICNTDKYHYLAWKEIADELNIDFNETINNRLRGISRMQSLDIILENYDGKTLTQEDKEHYADKKNEIYKKLLQAVSTSDLKPQVFQTLLKLREKGAKLAIGSSSKNAQLILNRLGLADFFDAISDGNNITHSKPNPEVFIRAAQMLNIPAEHCLVVEDAVAGIQAAQSAKMDNAGMSDAAQYAESTYKLNNFEDLLNCI